MQFHAANPFGLDIDLESAPSMAFGVADFVAGFGTSASQITGSAHRIRLNSYRNQGIIEKLSWQVIMYPKNSILLWFTKLYWSVSIF